MNTISFDRRWLLLLLLLIFILYPRGLVGVALLAIGAGWAIQAAMGALRLNRSSISGTKVTYWRGQRIETKLAPSQRFGALPVTQLIVGVLYGLLGVGMAISAVLLFARLTQLL